MDEGDAALRLARAMEYVLRAINYVSS